MADDEEDIYDDEFDFVDDELDDDLDEEEADEPQELEAEKDPFDDTDDADDADEVAEAEVVDEYGRPEPAANYVVHVYEYQKFKRTIDRPFTAEDAEAFASEYNRTAKPYGRFALAGKNDSKPRKSLD